MSDRELRGCPFCGEEPELFEKHLHLVVECMNYDECGFTMAEMLPSDIEEKDYIIESGDLIGMRADLVEKWNRRKETDIIMDQLDDALLKLEKVSDMCGVDIDEMF